MNMEKIKLDEIMSKLFIYWGLRSRSPLDKEDLLESSLIKDNPIHEILSKRVEKHGMIISPYFSTIMAIGTDENPGISIVLFYEILKKHVEKYGKLGEKYYLTPEDFSNVFIYNFPNSEEFSKYEKLWDSQKDEFGKNKVDNPEYWDLLFKGE